MALLATFANAQTANIICDFQATPSYTCALRGLQFPDNPALNFGISGSHLPGRTNADVVSVVIQDSQTPFIINELFAVFPNVDALTITSSGLTRIQPNAFVGGGNLREVTITNNPLTSLGPHSFFGALGIFTLNLQNNQLTNVDVDALYGLHGLHNILLSNNQLTRLPADVFLWRGNLRRIYLNNNRLDRLPGTLFEPARLVNEILLSNNDINAVGRNLINGLSSLARFEILNNGCVSRSWGVGDSNINQQIVEALDGCFQNYERFP